MKRLRILLVDDHVLVREGLKRVLEAQPDFELAGEADDGRKALEEAARLRPDLALIDLSMPLLGGIDVTRQLAQSSPALRIIGLTVHESEGYVYEFLKAGAHGYLLKRATTEELLHAVRTVGAGGTYVDPRVSRTLVEHLVGTKVGTTGPALSDRETEVLRLIAFGYANKEIAAQLDVSVKSVETYKARAMEKLNLRGRVDIVRLANERGWFAP
jgi:DNA-binding NarL/FixJ family response regulator